jgi:hypothetical protein
MSNPITLVTAFFDINRSQKGDGRTIEEYLQWLKKTLELNCNLYVFTEEKFRDFFLENRPKEYNMQIVVMDFKDLYYYKYYDKMKEILENPDYKSKIQHPNRVECKLPEYNIIQYSKFHCLQMAMDENIFQSSSFFWIDAGISRFFLDVDVSKSYPGESAIRSLQREGDVFIIQKRRDLEVFPIDENFIWKSDNLLYGTMFGGKPTTISKISREVERVLTYMFENNNVNNEQLALAMVWKNAQELFLFVDAVPGTHLILFKVLSY